MPAVMNVESRGLLRVLVVSTIPPKTGGIAQWTQLLFRWASKNSELDLRLIDIGPRWRAVEDHRRWKRIAAGGAQGLVDAFRLLCMAIRFRPNVIHLNTSGELRGPWDTFIIFCAKGLRIGVVYHIHMGRLPQILEKLGWEWWGMRGALHFSNHVIVLDSASERALCRILPSKKVSRLANGVPLSMAGTVRRTDVVGAVRTVLYLGHIYPSKGMSELMDAWRYLNPGDWRLRVVGAGSSRYKRELSMQVGEGLNLEFIGAVSPEMAWLEMQAASIFVLPSHSEGFPNAILEAMAASKPVVATRVGAVEEMLDANTEVPCGIVIEPRNVSALASALRQLISDRDLREALGRRARDKVERCYSVDRVFPRLTNIWHQCTSFGIDGKLRQPIHRENWRNRSCDIRPQMRTRLEKSPLRSSDGLGPEVLNETRSNVHYDDCRHDGPLEGLAGSILPLKDRQPVSAQADAAEIGQLEIDKLRVILLSTVPPTSGGIAQWTGRFLKWVESNPQVKIQLVDIGPRWRLVEDHRSWKRILSGGAQGVVDAFRFVSLLICFRPHVVHLNSSGEFRGPWDTLVVGLSRIFKIRTIYHLRMGRMPEIVRDRRWEWWGMLGALVFSSRVIVLDTSSETVLKGVLGFSRVKRLPNAVSVRSIPKENINRPSGIPTVLYLGHIYPSKGMVELMEAWRMLSPSGWCLRLAGVGSAQYKAALRKLAGHVVDVQFIGALSQEAAWEELRAAQVFVLPSHTEGFPNSILEAMAAGKAILSTRVGAIPEMLDVDTSEPCGVVVAPSDPVALASALRKLMEDQDLRGVLGQRARSKVERCYSMDIIFPRLIDHWTDI
jgi:glycosyltransferase involved in cell wall biosynthesis